jgi:RHS repeat-associated protein
VFDPDSAAVTDRWSYAYANHAATGIATTSAGARFLMQYDAAGNMVSQTDASKSLTKKMTYDSGNRIRKVIDGRTNIVKGEYWYDDQGFWVLKSANETERCRTTTKEILYPSMFYTLELNYDGQRLPNAAQCAVNTPTGTGVNNIYLNGVRVAGVMLDGEARYYLTDQVDSVKVVTNDSGMVVTSHEHLPFGEDWITEGDKKNAPKYNSQELDKESGYYFYNARHYDPEIGRFCTADNIVDGQYDTQGWNRYSYVRNNPVVYKDPTGHYSMDEFKSDVGKITNTLQSAANKISETASNANEGIKSKANDVLHKAKGLWWDATGQKPTLKITNVVEKNIDYGGGKKGMQGNSVVEWSTREGTEKFKVPNVQWYEGAIPGSTPSQPYEHPLQAGKYKLEYSPDTKFKIKVGKAEKNQDVESSTYVHRGNISEGCPVLGNTSQARKVEKDIISRVSKKENIFLEVKNTDERSYQERRNQPLPTTAQYPYPPWKD